MIQVGDRTFLDWVALGLHLSTLIRRYRSAQEHALSEPDFQFLVALLRRVPQAAMFQHPLAVIRVTANKKPPHFTVTDSRAVCTAVENQVFRNLAPRDLHQLRTFDPPCPACRAPLTRPEIFQMLQLGRTNHGAMRCSVCIS